MLILISSNVKHVKYTCRAIAVNNCETDYTMLSAVIYQVAHRTGKKIGAIAPNQRNNVITCKR